MIVVDLQGTEEDDQYILTDPSIHCQDPKFGKTNLRDVGIKQFFKTHRCGSVCEAIWDYQKISIWGNQENQGLEIVLQWLNDCGKPTWKNWEAAL